MKIRFLLLLLSALLIASAGGSLMNGVALIGDVVRLKQGKQAKQEKGKQGKR